MSKYVSFGMYWQCYGRQTIEIPDDIDLKDINAVIEYIESKWENIPLPSGDYVSNSDELDKESIETYEENLLKTKTINTEDIVGVYPLTNTGSLLIHKIDHTDDRVKVSLNGQFPSWCCIENEIIDSQLEPGFHWGDTFIPFNAVLRF